MLYKYYNPNPRSIRVGDCSVRALSYALRQDWETTYRQLTDLGLKMGDMPSSNAVWGELLYRNGFKRYVIPNECPDCYRIIDFCNDNPFGLFVLATGSHVVAVNNGDYYDTWDSGDEVPIYYWKRGEDDAFL